MTDQPVSVRVDLQVEGMGVRGHKMLIDEEWGTVHRHGMALAIVHRKPVTCKYKELPTGRQELAGTFTTLGFKPVEGV